MLQLYFHPFACSLAARIALMEADVAARYHLVHLWKKTVVDDGGDFRSVSTKGAVPVLVLEDGATLTENAAILQYIADRRPDLGLAPRPGEPLRYRLQEWLSFIGCEIHKAFLFPTFWYADDAAKAAARQRIGSTLAVASAHLDGNPYLVGDRFTVADGYLAWALLLMPRAGIDLAPWPALSAFLARIQARPQVAAAIAIERQVFKAMARESA